MRAFVIRQVGRTAVVDKPIPEPGPEEADDRHRAAIAVAGPTSGTVPKPGEAFTMEP